MCGNARMLHEDGTLAEAYRREAEMAENLADQINYLKIGR